MRGTLSFEKKLHISVLVSELLVDHAQEAASREFTKAKIAKGAVIEYAEDKNLTSAITRKDKWAVFFIKICFHIRKPDD